MRKELVAVQTGIVCAFIVLLALYVFVVGVANLEWSHVETLLPLGLSVASVFLLTIACSRKGACGRRFMLDADGAASDAHSGDF